MKGSLCCTTVWFFYQSKQLTDYIYTDIYCKLSKCIWTDSVNVWTSNFTLLLNICNLTTVLSPSGSQIERTTSKHKITTIKPTNPNKWEKNTNDAIDNPFNTMKLAQWMLDKMAGRVLDKPDHPALVKPPSLGKWSLRDDIWCSGTSTYSKILVSDNTTSRFDKSSSRPCGTILQAGLTA